MVFLYGIAVLLLSSNSSFSLFSSADFQELFKSNIPRGSSKFVNAQIYIISIGKADKLKRRNGLLRTDLEGESLKYIVEKSFGFLFIILSLRLSL